MPLLSANPKIFGIGLSRTGTQSLARALVALDFRTAHWDETERLVVFQDHEIVGLDLEGLAAYDAFLDIPIAFSFENLDRHFPGSRFVLTVRTISDWLASMRRHIGTMDREGSWTKTSRALHLALYGSVDYDEKRLATAYQRHVDKILAHFSGRGELLVLNVCGGEGWSPLCRFLGKPEPSLPFPRIS